MQITCPSCAARYVMSSDALGVKGRNVRCAKCGVTWFAEPPERETHIEDVTSSDAFPAVEISDFSSELRAQMNAPIQSFEIAKGRKSKTKTQLPGFVRDGTSVNRRMVVNIMIGLIALVMILCGAFFWLHSHKTKPTISNSAHIYDGTGLSFADVKAIGSGPLLTVRGSVKNDSRTPIALPALSAKLMQKDSQQTMEWIFRLPQAELAPSMSTAFEVSKSDLKIEGSQVSLSFVREK